MCADVLDDLGRSHDTQAGALNAASALCVAGEEPSREKVAGPSGIDKRLDG